MLAPPAVADQDSTRAFVFHRSDEPFDDCDAPELANGTESLLDASVSTPPMKPGVGELGSLVRDRVFWPHARRLADYESAGVVRLVL